MDILEVAAQNDPTQYIETPDRKYIIKLRLEQGNWGKRCWLTLYKPVAIDEVSGLPWFMNVDEQLGDTDVLDEAQSCVAGIVEDNGCYEMVTCPGDELPCGDNLDDILSFSTALVMAYRKACLLLKVKDDKGEPGEAWEVLCCAAVDTVKP